MVSYNVYLAESLGGGKGDHHAILVEHAALHSPAPNTGLRAFLYQVREVLPRA